MNSVISPLNRRVAPRMNKPFLIGVQLSSRHFCQSRALNISSTGLRMVVPQPVGEGTRLRLTLCLDENHVVEIEGQAVWQESLGSLDTHVVGFEFQSGHGDRAAQTALNGVEAWLREKGVAA